MMPLFMGKHQFPTGILLQEGQKYKINSRNPHKIDVADKDVLMYIHGKHLPNMIPLPGV